MHFHPPEAALLCESYLRWLWVKTTEGPTLQETDFLHLPIEMHNPSYGDCCRTKTSGHHSSVVSAIYRIYVYLLWRKL